MRILLPATAKAVEARIEAGTKRVISRREFLRSFSGAAAAVALGGCGGVLDVRGPSKRVVVVGAGLAGLVAAYELTEAGHDVVVLEARARVGGRVLTLRQPFSDGHFAEAGAARIPPDHNFTLDYSGHFGLNLDSFYPPTGSYIDYSNGNRRLTDANGFLATRPDYVKIRGGTDRLPTAFAAALGSRIRLSSPVVGVEQDANRVTVTVEGGSTLEADRVICTVPLPVLDHIQFAPELSTQKRAAAAGEFAYTPSTRVFVQFSERFWESEGLNGWAVTDWPEELWHPTWDRTGPRGLLLSYIRGERARTIDTLQESARVEAVLEHWEDVFPGVGAYVTGDAVHSWQDEPWSRAAWSSPSTLEFSRYGQAIRWPEGRIHFAGEHTSDDRAWMQGALASGLRAADEVHRSAT